MKIVVNNTKKRKLPKKEQWERIELGAQIIMNKKPNLKKVSNEKAS